MAKPQVAVLRTRRAAQHGLEMALDPPPVDPCFGCDTVHRQRIRHVVVHEPHHPRHQRVIGQRRVSAALGIAGAADAFVDQLVRNRLGQLIHERIRGPSDPQRGGDPALADHPLVARAVRIMQNHLSDPLPMDRIAAETGIDRRRIERQFQAVLGCAPGAHYRDLRLRHGIGLIRQFGLSVQAAAAACGYSSQAVFSRACKEHFGQAPRIFARGADKL